MSRKVLENWELTNLGEIIVTKNNKSKQLKSTEYRKTGIFPVVDQSINLICGYSDEKRKAISSDLPIIIFGDHTRHTKFISFPFIAGADGTQLLKPAKGIDDKFFYYLVSFASKKIGNYGYDRHFKHLKDFQCLYPTDECEQQKIAAILTAIDRAIAHTEALIEKYHQIKAGLMHDLFTRGIGADGKLRPTREEAPELYQESAIGWIPREWEIKYCSDLCTRICVGIVIKPAQYYVEDGIPAFRSANIREDGIDPDNLVYISPESNKLLAKSQVKEGDILSVRTGYPGTSAVVPEEFSGVNCVDILISTPGHRISSQYLCYWVNSSFGKEQVLRQQGGMAQQHFNVAEMRQLLVGLPSVREQNLVVDKLAVCDRKIEAEKETLAKLNKQKSGLMHDLLTGKVPVKVNPSEVSHV